MLQGDRFLFIVRIDTRYGSIIYIEWRREKVDDRIEDQLDSLFRGHELRTGNEIVLVTTYSYNGQPDLRSYAATCGDSLKVGKKRRNNGLVIAFSGHLREVYMAPGLGTEMVFPEWKCQKFADSLMVPLFKENMYFDGIWEGSKAVVNYLEEPGHEIN